MRGDRLQQVRVAQQHRRLAVALVRRGEPAELVGQPACPARVRPRPVVGRAGRRRRPSRPRAGPAPGRRAGRRPSSPPPRRPRSASPRPRPSRRRARCRPASRAPPSRPARRSPPARVHLGRVAQPGGDRDGLPGLQLGEGVRGGVGGRGRVGAGQPVCARRDHRRQLGGRSGHGHFPSSARRPVGPRHAHRSAARAGGLSRVARMAPHGNRRATVVATVGSGVAELRPDPGSPAGLDVARGRGAAVVRRPGRSDASRVRLSDPAGHGAAVVRPAARTPDGPASGWRRPGAAAPGGPSTARVCPEGGGT